MDVVPNFSDAEGNPAQDGVAAADRGDMRRSWAEALWADEGEPLTTPFEDWCTSQGIHPEKFGAWESYQAIRTTRDGSGVTA